MNINWTRKNRRGFTLIEALIGAALLALVFWGIFGAYRLGLKVLAISKNKISATMIANARIEEIRNLPYETVGVKNVALPFAQGTLDQVTTKTLNGVAFTITTKVRYVADSADGIDGEDGCALDYKKADVTVAWTEIFSGQVKLSTMVAPKSLVQELQSCQDQPGGVLTFKVFDSTGVAVPSPTISVYYQGTNNLADAVTPASGEHSFPLAVGTYRVEVAKNGYSSARTYGADEVAVPDVLNPTILNGQEINKSLSIDPGSALAIDGISPTGQDNFADSFEDQNLVGELSDTQFDAGAVKLAGTPYVASGWATSSAVNPGNLVVWDELQFDYNKPAGTSAIFQILYYDGNSWQLIPDSDLSQNSTGFTVSPVDISGLNKDIYAQLKIKGTLSTSDTSFTPSIYNWQIFWTTNIGVAVGGAGFHIQGTKTIGADAEGERVYKYSADSSLDGNGHLELANMDADNYTFSVDPLSGLSLIGIEPSPSPISAVAGQTAAVKLFLRAQNALLATVQNDTTLDPVFSASARLVNAGINYDKTQHTDQNGQTYFAPLQNGTYELTVAAAGYTGYTGTVTVAGESVKVTAIHQNE